MIDITTAVFLVVIAIAVVGIVLSAIGWCVERVMRWRDRRRADRAYLAGAELGKVLLAMPPQTDAEWAEVLTQVARDAKRFRRDRADPLV